MYSAFGFSAAHAFNEQNRYKKDNPNEVYVSTATYNGFRDEANITHGETSFDWTTDSGVDMSLRLLYMPLQYWYEYNVPYEQCVAIELAVDGEDEWYMPNNVAESLKSLRTVENIVKRHILADKSVKWVGFTPIPNFRGQRAKYFTYRLTKLMDYTPTIYQTEDSIFFSTTELPDLFAE